MAYTQPSDDSFRPVAGADGGATLEPRHVAPQDVHDHRLGDVVGVVT
jgi:hypothetical protein